MYRYIVLIIILIASFHSEAIGFWDDYLLNGSARTEYPIGKGTGSDYLDLRFNDNDLPGIEGCQFNAADAFTGCPGRAGLEDLPSGIPAWLGTVQHEEACSGDTTRIGDSWIGCLSYSQSPYFEINSPGEFYWVIGPNDDPAFDQCKPGPPNLSHPVLDFNSTEDGIYKVGMEDVLNGPSFKKRLQISINNTQHDFFCNQTGQYQNSIPFLSVGAQKERGNQQAVGLIGTDNKGAQSLLEFNIRAPHYVPFGCPIGVFDVCTINSNFGVHAGIFAIASWNNVHHMVFFDFIREGVYASQPNQAKGLWNWPIKDSFYYPGAEIVAFASSSEINSQCDVNYTNLALNSDIFRNYNIDLTKLFRCAQNAGYFPNLPSTEIEIEGVHWYIETTGLVGEIEIEIEDIHMSLDDLIFQHGF